MARHDPRAAVADAAASALEGVLATHSHSWDSKTWSQNWTHGLGYVLDLPPQEPPSPSEGPVPVLLFSRDCLTGGTSGHAFPVEADGAILSLRATASRLMMQVGWSIEALERIERHAAAHLPAAFGGIRHNIDSSRDVFLQVSILPQDRGLSRP